MANSCPYILFRVGHTLCGIDSLSITEIIKYQTPTIAYRCSCDVHGAINLRGRVVILIDLQNLFGLRAVSVTKDTRLLINETSDELIGYVVDDLIDIIDIVPDDISFLPVHVHKLPDRTIIGSIQTPYGLATILDINVLQEL